MNKKTLILMLASGLLLASCGENNSTSTRPANGSFEEPLSIAEFNALASTLGLSHQEYSTEHYYVKGIVKDVPSFTKTTQSYTFKIADNKNSSSYINVGGAIILDEDNVLVPNQNDTVIIYGLCENYNDYYSIYYNDYGDSPVIMSTTLGKSTVTSSVEHGSIVGLEKSYTNGDTVSFSIDVDNGYTLNRVMVDSEILTAEEGKYSFVIYGDKTIEVDISDNSVTSAKITLDFANKKVPVDGLTKDDVTNGEITHEVTWDGITYLTKGVIANSTYLMMKSKDFGTPAFIANVTPINGKITKVEIKTRSNASDSSKYSIDFSNVPIVEAIVEETINVKKGSYYSEKANAEDAYSYFAISADTVANNQLALIEVTYIPN